MIKEKSKPLSFCGQYIRKSDPDHFFCALFMPSDLREQYFRLLAFYTEITRAVTLSSSWDVAGPMAGYIRLQWWRDLLANKPDRDHEIAPYIKDSLERNLFSAEDLLKIISAREEELEGIKNWDHWDSIMVRSVGQIQRILANLFKIRELPLVEAVIAAGIASETVHISKNLPNIFRKGRCPLPAEIIHDFSLQRSENGISVTSSELNAIRDILIEKAYFYLRRSEKACLLDRHYRSVILPVILAKRDLHRFEQWDHLSRKRGIGDKLSVLKANYWVKLKISET